MCRRCGLAQPDKPKAATKQQPARPNARLPALAPWASTEMAEERAAQIETAIVVAKKAGGLEPEIKKMEQALAQQRKKAAEPTSALSQIEATKAFLERAEKRRGAAAEEIETLRAQKAEMDQEIQKAQERLANMEIEAAKVLNIPKAQNSEGAINALEDAVRTLMVAMHSCQQLPPQVAQAAEALATCLPPARPSDDSGRGLEEADVVEEEERIMMEMDRDLEDHQLLALAKELRVKRARTS